MKNVEVSKKQIATKNISLECSLNHCIIFFIILFVGTLVYKIQQSYSANCSNDQTASLLNRFLQIQQSQKGEKYDSAKKKSSDVEFHHSSANSQGQKQQLGDVQSEGENFQSSALPAMQNVILDPLIMIENWWPKPNIQYYMYTSSNQNFVWDIQKLTQIDRKKYLQLNEWKNSSNQKIRFQALGSNKFRIYNRKLDKTLKIQSNECKAQSNYAFFSSPSEQNDQIWQLISVEYFNGQYYSPNNNFLYIKSYCGEYLSFEDNPMSHKSIILSKFNERNHNNIWFVRSNIVVFGEEGKQVLSLEKFMKEEQEERKQKLIKKYSLLFTKTVENLAAYDSLEHFQQSVKLEQIKKQISQSLSKAPNFMTKSKLIQSQKDLPPSPFDQNSKHKQLSSSHEFSSQISINLCPRNHVVAYIWFGHAKIPAQYKKIIDQCKQTTILLKKDNFLTYTQKWNLQNPKLQIDLQNFDVRQQINQLKLLYLYYQSGIYADFDTQINQECFQNIITDEIIWTNYLSEGRGDIWMPIEQILVPEQNFMMVLNKKNEQVKRMLQNEIKQARHMDGGGRWRQCKYRQCLIVNCQRHLRDNTYNKGFQ